MRIDGYQLDYPGSSVKSHEDHAKRSGRLEPLEHQAARGFCHRVAELHPQWAKAATLGSRRNGWFARTI